MFENTLQDAFVTGSDEAFERLTSAVGKRSIFLGMNDLSILLFLLLHLHIRSKSLNVHGLSAVTHTDVGED